MFEQRDNSVTKDRLEVKALQGNNITMKYGNNRRNMNREPQFVLELIFSVTF